MKKTAAFLSLFTMGLVLAAPAFAHCDMDDDQCSMKGRRECGGDPGQCPVTGMFLKKADFVLDHKDDLALTDAQAETIKGLQLDVQKIAVRQSADMQIFMLDLMAKLHEEKIDVEAANAAIDKGSASMTESVKSVVASLAKLKETLTPDQMKKMKELWTAKKTS